MRHRVDFFNGLLASAAVHDTEAVIPRKRRWLTWVLSLAGGALFLGLASQRLDVWPQGRVVLRPELLIAALALHVPYVWVRALRLQFAFDPIVQADSGNPSARFDRRVLYGSGMVSFFVLLVLPFKLGEVSRPLLLVRGRQPGVGTTEAVGGVALERLLDGLIICTMLFGGLALSQPALGDALSNTRVVGAGLLGVFVVGLFVLLWAGRDPARAQRVTERLVGLASEKLAVRLAAIVGRFAVAMRGVLDLRQGGWLVVCSLVYWAVTTMQLWLVLQATGVHLGFAEAAAVVAIIGLSIQLPGGPAQLGTFQVGALGSLSLFLTAGELESAGSGFTIVMYLFQFAAAGLLALPGLALLAWHRRTPDSRSGRRADPAEPT